MNVSSKHELCTQTTEYERNSFSVFSVLMRKAGDNKWVDSNKRSNYELNVDWREKRSEKIFGQNKQIKQQLKRKEERNKEKEKEKKEKKCTERDK